MLRPAVKRNIHLQQCNVNFGGKDSCENQHIVCGKKIEATSRRLPMHIGYFMYASAAYASDNSFKNNV